MGDKIAVTQPKLLQSVQHPEDSTYFVSIDGAENVMENQIAARSDNVITGGGNTTFYFNPATSNTIMDRVVLLQCSVIVTMPAGNLWGRFAPVSFPLNSAIKSLQVKINGKSETTEPFRMKGFWERMHTSDLIKRQFQSYTPVMRDNDYEYNKMAARESFSPFTYPEKVGSYFTPRAEFAYTVDNTGLIRTYTFTEPLLIDLFEVSSQEGIYNLANVEINIVWVTNLAAYMFSDPIFIKADGTTTAGLVGPARTVDGGDDFPSTLVGRTAQDISKYSMFEVKTSALAVIDTHTYISHHTLYSTGGGLADLSTLNTIPAYTAVIDKGSKLLVRYMEASSELEHVLNLPYLSYNRILKQASEAITPSVNKVYTISFDQISQDIIPAYGIIQVKRSLDDRTVSYLADSCYPIDKVSITLGNKPGLLSNATPEQLWQMSVRNGLDVSWDEWRYRGQCIVLFKFGEDIGGLVPGASAMMRMQIKVDFKNPYTLTAGYKTDAELFLVTPGMLTLMPNAMNLQLGINDNSALEEAKFNPVSFDSEDGLTGEVRSGAGFKTSFGKGRKIFSSALNIGHALANMGAELTGDSRLNKLSSALGAASRVNKMTGGGQLKN